MHLCYLWSVTPSVGTEGHCWSLMASVKRWSIPGISQSSHAAITAIWKLYSQLHAINLHILVSCALKKSQNTSSTVMLLTLHHCAALSSSGLTTCGFNWSQLYIKHAFIEHVCFSVQWDDLIRWRNMNDFNYTNYLNRNRFYIRPNEWIYHQLSLN